MLPLPNNLLHKRNLKHRHSSHPRTDDLSTQSTRVTYFAKIRVCQPVICGTGYNFPAYGVQKSCTIIGPRAL